MTCQVSRFCSETHTIPSRIVTWCEKNMSKFPHFPTPAAYILMTFHSFNLKKSPLSISLQSPNRMLACLLLGDQSTGLIWSLRLLGFSISSPHPPLSPSIHMILIHSPSQSFRTQAHSYNSLSHRTTAQLLVFGLRKGVGVG